MTTPREEKALHDVFIFSVWVKGLVGLLQTLGGSAFLLVPQPTLTRWIARMTAPEIAGDPHDFFATVLRHTAEHWATGTQTFAGVYLLLHGVIKLILVAALLRRRMWSYPASMWVLGAFIVYQMYRYTFTHSPWLLALTALDVAVVALIHHEYGQRKLLGFPGERAAAAKPPAD